MAIKKPTLSRLNSFERIMCLKTTNVLRQFRFVIRSFILMDNITLSQSVQHRTYFLVKTFCFFFVRGVSQFLYESSGCGCIIAISQPLNPALSDSL